MYYSARDWQNEYTDDKGRKRTDSAGVYAHIGVAVLSMESTEAVTVRERSSTNPDIARRPLDPKDLSAFQRPVAGVLGTNPPQPKKTEPGTQVTGKSARNGGQPRNVVRDSVVLDDTVAAGRTN